MVPGTAWSYLIVERGHFVLNDAQTPGSAPTGSVLTQIVNARTGQVTDVGVSNRVPQLERLGRITIDKH